VWNSKITLLDNANIGCLNFDALGPAFFCGGQYDDVRIFSTALTTNQIQGIYNSGNGTEADND
jgi:hypothetical protein